MITVNLKGGLGNQLFQIATGYATATSLGYKFYIVKNNFLGCSQGSHPSKYYESIYKKIPMVDSLKIDTHIHEESFIYKSIRHRIPTGVTCLNGYFQSEMYFKDYSAEIKDLLRPVGFQPKYPELLDDHDYCFIGVRRGDYLESANAAIHNPCNLIYYKAAISKMNKDIYYIASDDIAWCRQQFIGSQYRFIEADDIETFYTMALFRNYIIANSTFHWWGSFMSVYDKPYIIAPDKWVFGPNTKREQYWSIYRDDMEVLERNI
jgi:hypothetical protein